LNEYSYWWTPFRRIGPGAKGQGFERTRSTWPSSARVYRAVGGTASRASRASVVVLEREWVGWGASSRNGGQVLTGLKLDPATLVARYGEGQARLLFDVSSNRSPPSRRSSPANRLTANTNGAAPAGCVEAGSFRRISSGADAAGAVFQHHVELVSRRDQRSSSAAMCTTACWSTSAARPQSGRYVRDWPTRSSGQGRHRRGDACRALRQTRRSVTVTTPQGDIEAGDVLVATNGYTDGAAPALQRRFVPIGSYVIATEPLESPIAELSCLGDGWCSTRSTSFTTSASHATTV